ncbi:MAG: S8 family serine peptidase [Pseudomonadota bacterium]
MKSDRSPGRFLIVTALLLCLMLRAESAAPNGVATNPSTHPHAAGQVLLQYKQTFSKNAARSRISGLGGFVVQTHPKLNVDLIQFDPSGDLQQKLIQLHSDPAVAWAQRNYQLKTNIVPNDSSFASRQWAMNNTGDNVQVGVSDAGIPGADMNMVAAWDIQRLADGIKIAIIDDAVLTSHPDLQANVTATGRCFDADGSYCVGGTTNVDPTANDQGHGTLVAGAAGARGNNFSGIAGAAWQVDLVPFKSDLFNSSLVAAIDEAVNQNVDIINMSLGGPIEFGVSAMAIARDQGILIVTSAGNADNNSDLARTHYPSDTNLPNILSVAATTGRDELTRFSQWGPFTVDIAAPGESIFTTAQNSALATTSGTSFSSPFVAGVAALIKANTGVTGPDAWKTLKAYLLHGGVNGVGLGSANVPGNNKLAVPGRVVSGRLDGERALQGPSGGVLVINSVTVDDSVLGNNNGILDPNETADLEITLENVWSTESNVSGVLSVLDSNQFPSELDSGLLSITTPNGNFGTVVKDGFSSAKFRVSLGNLTDNEQYFFTLNLSSNAGPLTPRYFYHEVGQITNGVTKNQLIGRNNWDEFQTFTLDVPVGATNLRVRTTSTNSIDIDLLLRKDEYPEFLIALAEDPEDPNASPQFFTGSDTFSSGNFDGTESITPTGELGGTWYATVVNFDQVRHTYALTATFDAPPDADNDGIGDAQDNCPNDPNPNQQNTDNDAQGDVCDTDDDNDGVVDTEDAFPLDPSETIDTDNDGIGNNADQDDDNDGMPDGFETSNGLDPLDAADATQDADSDGLNNLDEFLAGSNPNNTDSDADTLIDGMDNCPADTNVDQMDSDNDGAGDVCDNTINIYDVAMTPDLDGDLSPETASLFVLPSGGLTVQLSDGLNGASIGRINYLSTGQWRGQSVFAIPDVGNNGGPAIAVAATRISDGLPILQIKNLDGSLLRNVFPLSASWTLLQTAVVPGAGPNNGPAVAALASRNSDGLMVVQLRNPTDNTLIRNIFPLGLTWRALSMTVLEDVNGNDAAIGVLSERISDGLTAVQVRNASDGSLIRNVFPLGLGWSALEVKTVPDLNQSNVDEIAVRMTRDADGLEIIQIRDAASNAFVTNHYPIGAGAGGWQTESFESISNSGAAALAILSTRVSDQQILVQVRDANSSAILNNTFFLGPPWTQRSLSVVEDINGNDVSEVSVIARNPLTKTDVTQTRDATTATLLNNVLLVP